MAKTLKNIFDKITSIENLEMAYKNAIRNKRYTYGSLTFTANLMDNLIKIQDDLQRGYFKPGQFREKIIHDPKTRLIMVQPFRDRVIHWAFYQVINPYLVKGYIKDSYACIEGRGQIKAVERLQRWMYAEKLQQENDGKIKYTLKMDISKFFYRVPHKELLKEFNRKVSDKNVQRWVKEQLEGTNHNFGLPVGMDVLSVPKEDRLSDRGMPIGTLLSQMLANMYMNQVDQYAKRTLGIKRYTRYNDDIIIIGTKSQVMLYREKLTEFIEQSLKMEVNPRKTCIAPIYKGVEYCGRKIYPTHYHLRKSTSLRMKRSLKGVMNRYRYSQISAERAMQTANSYVALLEHGNNERLKHSIFGTDEYGTGGWFVLKKE